MAPRKAKLDVCFFCDESPCVCNKPKKATVKPAAPVAKKVESQPAPVTPEPDPVFIAPRPRVVRKITSAAPVGITLPVAPVVKPAAPSVKKVERTLTDAEIIEIVALQNLAHAGLIDTRNNPDLGGLITMKLSPQQRAIAWKAML